MKSENNVTENTAEAKETQRKYSSYDRRPNDNKRPTNRKNNYRYNKQQRNNRHNDKNSDRNDNRNDKTDRSERNSRSNFRSGQSKAAAEFGASSDGASPKHRQKLLSRHLPKFRTEIQASADARVLPNSRSFR